MTVTLELAYLGTTHICLPVCLLQPRLLAKHRNPSGKHIEFVPSLEMLFSLIQITVMVEYEPLRNDGMEKKHHVTNLTGQNIPAETEDTVKTSGID